MLIRLVDDEYVRKLVEVAESPVFILFVTADAKGAAARKVLESLVEHYENRVVFVTVRSEENPTLGNELVGVDDRPAAVIMKKREKVAMIGPLGLQDRDAVAKQLAVALVAKKREK